MVLPHQSLKTLCSDSVRLELWDAALDVLREVFEVTKVRVSPARGGEAFRLVLLLGGREASLGEFRWSVEEYHSEHEEGDGQEHELQETAQGQ